MEADFRRFMATLEALKVEHALSSETVADLKQSIERYRRPAVANAGKKLQCSAAASERLSRYLEAGGWLEDAAQSLAFRIDSAIRKLHRHLREAEVHCESLSRTLETVLGAACPRSFQQSSAATTEELDVIQKLQNLDIASSEEEMDPVLSDLEEIASDSKAQSGPYSFSDCVPLMALIVMMVEQDLEMRKKVVAALGLDTPSPSLEAYTLMWTLRPFMDDQICDQALRLVKP
ncbi:hypothetical protein MPTK1_1g27310 [Marchantia polymorpha subsp. ruderalis]|nr:hypothetical protein MARPO_0002s0147 [Marchantia polymorpha]BBN00212.1 hypothetical protein Mp_1g27310 [Marchantia polymorpha subsp. ruderalis]|eukprot:PTQ49672.1 hypothetical protein MARPO_0002s0147 [Marchantia polymorpha]